MKKKQRYSLGNLLAWRNFHLTFSSPTSKKIVESSLDSLSVNISYMTRFPNFHIFWGKSNQTIVDMSHHQENLTKQFWNNDVLEKLRDSLLLFVCLQALSTAKIPNEEFLKVESCNLNCNKLRCLITDGAAQIFRNRKLWLEIISFEHLTPESANVFPEIKKLQFDSYHFNHLTTAVSNWSWKFDGLKKYFFVLIRLLAC